LNTRFEFHILKKSTIKDFSVFGAALAAGGADFI
jgi:hypothetical protein